MADSTKEEQTYNDQDQEEFSSVVIPSFTGLTNAYQESQVDLSVSCLLPIDTKTRLETRIRQRILSMLKTSPIFYLLI